MRIHLDLDLTERLGERLSLPEAQARHVGLVMRARVGQRLSLFDGRGHEVEAQIERADRKAVEVSVLDLRQARPESPLAVHLGQVVSKGERMEFAIQKSVELGVAAITPLYSEHGDVRLKGEREAKKLAHWQAVAVSACEQCGRAWVPEVHPPRALGDWLAERREELRLILHPGETSRALSGPAPSDAALLIGPEGGFSITEVDTARSHGFDALALGPRILRTETAPIVALTLLQHLYGDL
ncbi:16S rRNA (uracil(1498)-N(3))-methyltransferase [Halotalea alkalilenta]|uniref:Ribosomal RNA small subunit methyltransferase E n=1 Tax=Halotalea alkalilenta TaxID=376489 RepID=A0A172YBN5_9GAMM|nr:16S rRNA (uracil(1498)-N(3))-methyltransferase [Halotalea alkalilenta]ANF56634.1 16S rRNA (uracil(1498)-N(3))-methyltransferase [Halotalea alkalilenta]